MKALLRAVLVLAVLTALIGTIAAYSIARRGLSTRVEPSRLETQIARTMRRLATPAEVRGKKNPVPLTKAIVQAGLEHFADHCAVCHANDGSGDTTMGRNLYPRAPDMRAEGTQSLSDGEIFSIIENGIRLTGMPAWGDGNPEGEQVGWHLVHFIRHLPRLTPDEIAQMEALNPKSPAEWQADEEARRFLEGGESQPAPKPSAERKPHRH